MTPNMTFQKRQNYKDSEKITGGLLAVWGGGHRQNRGFKGNENTLYYIIP